MFRIVSSVALTFSGTTISDLLICEQSSLRGVRVIR